MDQATVDRFQEELTKEREASSKAWEAFDEYRVEHRDKGTDFTQDSEAFENGEKLHKEYSEHADKAAQLESDLLKAVKMLGGDAAKPLEDAPKDATEALQRQGLKSAGHTFTESPEYKAALEKGIPQSEHGKVEIGPVKVYDRSEVKTLITGLSDTSGGGFVINDRQPGFYQVLLQQPTVIEMVTLGETNSDTVEYVKQTSFTNNAAETLEAVDLTTGTKPESAMAFQIVQELVQTIAHWIPVTKRALADAAGMRTVIDALMREGVRQRLETQVIAGNGTTPNLRGILNQAGIGTQAKGADKPEDAIHKAITTIRLAFIEPTAIGMHPTDWQTIRLGRNANGDLLLGPANVPGPEQLWGLPVAKSVAFTQGTSLVGKYDEAILWTREGITLSASDSHSDFFIKNLVAILAEGRWAFGLPRPGAFCKVTGL